MKIRNLYIPCGDPEAQTIRITAKYGWRKDPISGQPSFHNGIDLRSYNLPNNEIQGLIYAVCDGVVGQVVAPDSEYPSRYVNCQLDATIPSDRAWTPYLILKSDIDWFRYVHVKPLVELNEHVERGQPIAITDKNYGYSTAIHLHLEHTVFGVNPGQIDPLPALLESGIRIVSGVEMDKSYSKFLRGKK